MALAYLTRGAGLAAGMKAGAAKDLGTKATAALFGLMEKGRFYVSAREKGVDVATADYASNIAGVANAFLENYGLENILKESGSMIWATLRGGLVEGSEEFLQDMSSGILDLGITGKIMDAESWKGLFQQALYSGTLGAMLGTGAGAIGADIENELKSKGISDEGIQNFSNYVDNKAKQVIVKE